VSFSAIVTIPKAIANHDSEGAVEVLTQQEADFLIAAAKRFVDVDLIPLPGQGACLTLELAAIQTPRHFVWT